MDLCNWYMGVYDQTTRVCDNEYILSAVLSPAVTTINHIFGNIDSVQPHIQNQQQPTNPLHAPPQNKN